MLEKDLENKDKRLRRLQADRKILKEEILEEDIDKAHDEQ